jgi:hypothetical protein
VRLCGQAQASAGAIADSAVVVNHRVDLPEVSAQSHVGSDEQAVHALLARVGPDVALVLVCCDDQEMRQVVVARAADRASESWDGSRAQFVGVLDPGSQHDWLRAAVDEPSSTNR